MHRQSLLEQLKRYAQAHVEQANTARRIVALIEAHVDCFDRTCKPGHITASAWVTSADRRRHLLVHHRKLNKWLQPGGHADGDPDAAAVALREVAEETGLEEIRLHGDSPFDIDVHQIPARRDIHGSIVEDAHEHHDIRFLCLANCEQALSISEESHDVRWFSETEVRSVTGEPSVLRMLDKALATR